VADAYDTWTDEQYAAERQRLSEAARALDELRKTIPSAGGVGLEEFGTAGLTQLSPEQTALDAEVARRQRELNTQQAAVDSAMKRAEERKRTEAARAQVGAALGDKPATSPAAATYSPADLANFDELAGVGGAASQATQPAERQYKTIIGSRRDERGNVVFETQRVPVDQQPVSQGQGEYQGAGLGVDEWKRQALGENAQRAAATRAFQMAHPEQTSYSRETGEPTTGFQVREGQGGFSPSRQRPGLEKTWEEVSRTESPALQDLWLRDKQQALAISGQEEALKEIETRRRLGAAQTGLAERELQERVDPSLVTRGQIASYNVMRQEFGQQQADQIEADVKAALEVLSKQGQVSPALAEAIRQNVMRKYLTPDQLQNFQQRLAATTSPTVAAAQARTTPSYQ
jgi:hypothetical protein